jgi:hypothetical protein
MAAVASQSSLWRIALEMEKQDGSHFAMLWLKRIERSF